MTKIILNGREVEADPSKPLIAACHAHAENVPMYCYHPGLSQVGSCRICQVEVKQGEAPARVVAACRTPVAEGMLVDTESDGAHLARKQCLEFLLKNHPLDCPICDKAGECTLQDYTYQEGQDESRSAEPRRKLEKRVDLGDVIVLDQERCILCSRCVRFFEEVPGKAQLAITGLGSRSVVSTFMDRPLEGNYQGNIADICPVGALTLKKFRFQARVWNLRKTMSSCGECSRGCSTTVEVLRGKHVKRIRPRYDAEVNRWWMCDAGRFAFEQFDRGERAGAPLLRGAQGLEPASTADAFAAAAEVLGLHPVPVVLASPFITQEEGAQLKQLAGKLGSEARFLSPAPNELADELLHTGDPAPNRRGLSDLGFLATTADEAAALLADAPSALIVGERAAALLGEGALAALPAALRLVLADTAPGDTAGDQPAVNVRFGLANLAEREGTWINVDGLERRIRPAKAAPAGAEPLRRVLTALEAGVDALLARGEPAAAEGTR